MGHPANDTYRLTDQVLGTHRMLDEDVARHDAIRADVWMLKTTYGLMLRAPDVRAISIRGRFRKASSPIRSVGALEAETYRDDNKRFSKLVRAGLHPLDPLAQDALNARLVLVD